MKRIVMKWIGVLVSAAFAAFALLPVFPVDALAQGFVTGSGSSESGSSILGLVHDQGNGVGKGFFTIILHRNVPEGNTAAVVCKYKEFNDLVISGNTATFHSVGSCKILTVSGTLQPFTSDNTFIIVDDGEPGAGIDALDVNFLGASGLSIPGGFLMEGNFIVSP